MKQEIDRRFNLVKNNPSYKMFVAEVPLLYEAGMEKDYDAVIAVIHWTKRSHGKDLLPDYFEMRWKRQDKNKSAKADFVITNNGDLNILRSSIDAILDRLI